MRAASQASLERGRALISAAQLGPTYLDIADQFFGVADLLTQHSALVRALTNPNRQPAAKEKLAANVFAPLAPIVVQVMQTLAANRWSAAADIITATEDLGTEVVLTGSRNDRELGTLENQIFQVAEFLTHHRELRTALADTRSATPANRVALANKIFAPTLTAATMKLVERVVATVIHGRLHSALMRVGRRASSALAAKMVIVEAARIPSAPQLQRLQTILESRYHTPVTMNVRLDPQLIGGIRVHIGNDVIEGSLATALADTRRALAGKHR